MAQYRWSRRNTVEGWPLVRQQSINWKLYRHKGSSMTKKSEIPHTRRKVPDFGKQEETLKEAKNPKLRILWYAFCFWWIVCRQRKRSAVSQFGRTVQRPENIKLATETSGKTAVVKRRCGRQNNKRFEQMEWKIIGSPCSAEAGLVCSKCCPQSGNPKGQR